MAEKRDLASQRLMQSHYRPADLFPAAANHAVEADDFTRVDVE